jgi:hypothetical protein
VGCFLFLPGRARGPTTRRPTPTHTIYYAALVGGGRRPFGPHLAAAAVSQTLSAEHVGRGGCPTWVVFCSSQDGRVVQPRGAPHQPTLFTIPRWLAGGTKNNPLWTISAPNVFSRQGVGDLRGGKVWSKWAAPPANQRGIVNSVGWRGAPRGWTTRPAWEEQKTIHFGQPPRPTCSADRVWETAAAARCGPNGRRLPPTNAE